MKISAFNKFVKGEVTPYKLRDATVVVDGQNFFYRTYEEAGLTRAFGIESDRYASYLREYLGMFKKANIKCYFIFKGGHGNLASRLNEHNNNWVGVPMFMKEIYKQVLREMNFEYVVCEYESKRDVIELAQTLNCPVISNDIEFCFSGLQYLPSTTLQFNAADNTINCGCFLFADFLKKHNLTAEKMAVFIALRDERLFPASAFSNFFKHLKPLGIRDRNLHLLKWLSGIGYDQIIKKILISLSPEDEREFIEKEKQVSLLVERRESGGLGAAYLLNPDAARVARADPNWFTKGIAAGHVAIDYINLYRSKVFFGSDLIEGFNNATLPSLHIIYYAYDLLTDFKNDGFTFVYEVDYGRDGKRRMQVTNTRSIRKPAYKAEECVFESGWESVRSLGLLEHFVRETLKLESLQQIDGAPEEARLLLLALAYCERRPMPSRAAAVLMSYIALDTIYNNANNNSPAQFTKSGTTVNKVTSEDCSIASIILEEYHTASDSDAEQMLDRTLLHSLMEFQQCLLRLSELNALCGGELLAPVLARTYNGTLTYKLLRAAHGAANPGSFFKDLLRPAPTVCAYFEDLFRIYENNIVLCV